jgi:hypothetical protein
MVEDLYLPGVLSHSGELSPPSRTPREDGAPCSAHRGAHVQKSWAGGLHSGMFHVEHFAIAKPLSGPSRNGGAQDETPKWDLRRSD